MDENRASALCPAARRLMDTDILVIGGGLSGLALTGALIAAGQDALLFEARGRLGGRIECFETGNAAYDLGPAWFWPGQPRIGALIERFGLTQFDQFSEGALTFEDERGQVQRGRGFSSMEGSLRVKGGFGTLISALAEAVPEARLRLGSEVTSLIKGEDEVVATCADGQRLSARRVVLAMPPRVACRITFDPALPDTTMNAMSAVPTWMAEQAKAIALYDSPFWREAGLSGDAMSRAGPMVEIHDASPMHGGPYALFGFVGVPPAAREDEDALKDAVRAQLGRLFGITALTPRKLMIRDWAQEVFTASVQDHAPLMAHPTYSLPDDMAGLWDDTLIFAGTEVAPQFGGYLEGALEAAEVVFAQLYAGHHVAQGVTSA